MKNLILMFLVIPVMVVAQELPAPNSIYVSTQCYMNDGYSMQDVVEQFRESNIAGPRRVFVRQPISSLSAAENEFIRIVVWEDMEAWATNVSLGSPSPTDTYSCNNAQRRFYTNRRVGTNDSAYEDGVSLVTTMRCELTKGTTISDTYFNLNKNQVAREEAGDTTILQFSHLLLGPNPDGEMRSSIIIRRVGDTEAGLARSLDMMWENNLSIGTPINAPAKSCENPTLWRSYLVSN